MAEPLFRALCRERLTPLGRLFGLSRAEPVPPPEHLLDENGELPCGCAELCHVCGPAVAQVTIYTSQKEDGRE